MTWLDRDTADRGRGASRAASGHYIHKPTSFSRSRRCRFTTSSRLARSRWRRAASAWATMHRRWVRVNVRRGLPWRSHLMVLTCPRRNGYRIKCRSTVRFVSSASTSSEGDIIADNAVTSSATSAHRRATTLKASRTRSRGFARIVTKRSLT